MLFPRTLTRCALLARRSSRHFHRNALQAFPVIPFKLADIGEGIAEVEVLQWFVNEGDAIKQFQNVCEVQSDKATVEITSRYDGKITKVHYNVGEMAKVGQPLIDIEVDESAVDSGKSAKKATSLEDLVSLDNKPAAPAAAAAAAPTPVYEEQPEAPVHVPAQAPASTFTPSPQQQFTPDRSAKLLTTPAVRRLAREHDLDLHLVMPTGPNNRILKEDVLNYIRNKSAAQQSSAAGQSTTESQEHAAAQSASPASKKFVEHRYLEANKTVPLTAIQKAMTKSMTVALTIPHFGYDDEVDMDNLYNLRMQLKKFAEERGVKLSYMPFMIKAASLALKEFPTINSTLDEAQSQITLLASHNISVAVDSPAGLIVPNIKDVQNKSIVDIARDLNRLQDLASRGKLGQADLTGGTFSLSNIGSIGGTYARPVILPPQVAIGALGKIQTLPRFDEDGNVIASRIMKISWSGDHRVIDGATMARFSNRWKGYLENPTEMIAEMS